MYNKHIYDITEQAQQQQLTHKHDIEEVHPIADAAADTAVEVPQNKKVKAVKAQTKRGDLTMEQMLDDASGSITSVLCNSRNQRCVGHVHYDY